jgi:hypothetical protein
VNEAQVDRVKKVIENKFKNISSSMINAENGHTPGNYDIVTCLEVLEHIPDWKKAVKYACDSARKFVILSFPSKEDDNPEHIHLLDKKEVSKEVKIQDGIEFVKFDYVNGHIFIVARKKKL